MTEPGQRASDGADAETTDVSDAKPIAEDVGARIGPYKLLQRIGEGGFGTVFLAEQTAPVRRRVALKVVKLGMDTRQVVARFEAERQALALMDHPHIAKVLDAGATPSGRPFFVMEYVVGDPITAFADSHRLTVNDRLGLFGQVCSAVQHAHTKGIIHRDLKPANILVNMVDGAPFANVIDFGIAKAAAQSLTERTLFTMHGQLIGTPEYMSPEQAEGSPDIDTRTDVYALGVVLYELLTGLTPFDARRLRGAAFAELIRIIRDEDPPSPSARLSRSLDALAKHAAARGVGPARLGAMVRGELDWIVMKALDKDRSRRYETAAALGDDVRRHLTGDPVDAAPASTMYRVRKFVRRHRAGVTAGAVIAGMLLLGIGGTSWGLWKAKRSNERLRLLHLAANEAAERIAGAVPERFWMGGPTSGTDKEPVLDDLGRPRGTIVYQWITDADRNRRITFQELDAQGRPADNGLLVEFISRHTTALFRAFEDEIDRLKAQVAEPRPAPIAAVKAARFLPEMWGEPARRAGVACQDGALPTSVPGGTLWTFSDTFLGTRAEDGTPKVTGALSNTMAFLPTDATGWPPRLEYLAAGAGGQATAPLSVRSDEDPKTRRLWPLAGVWLENAGAGVGATAGRAYMFYGLVEVTGSGPWGFKSAGTGLARADAPFGAYERLPQPAGGWPIDPSSLVRRDGYLYLFAPRRFKGEQDVSSGLLVARVPERAIEDPASYEFFAGMDASGGGVSPRWTRRVEDAAPAAESVWGQASVAWSGYLGAYVLATASNIFRHDQIQIRSGPTAWGPWTPVGTNEGYVKVPERPGEETQLIYCAMLHPELDEQDGRVITLTFCRMLKREWALTNPEGVRIELELSR
jgi:serine/threonine protein kinase